MRRFIYILKRIGGFDYKRMFMTAKKISKICHKPVLFIVFDMIYCAIQFGAGYMDYFEFEFYLLNNLQRKSYLTVEMNNRIIANYNDKSEMKKFSNKTLFNKIFKNYIHRDYIDLNHADKTEFKNFCSDKMMVVCKKPCSMGGKGVEFLECNLDLDKAYDDLKNGGYTLIEEYIIQDPMMNKLYNGSVNTLRMITFVDDDHEVQLLNSVVRIGNGGVVDNFSSGGMYAFVNEEGEVITPAIDEEGNNYTYHPISKTKIEGFKIPKFNETIELVKNAALVIDKVRYVGWDVAIGEDGPLILEGNEYSGIFQKKPSLNKDKLGLLPLYQKYMKL